MEEGSAVRWLQEEVRVEDRLAGPLEGDDEGTVPKAEVFRAIWTPKPRNVDTSSSSSQDGTEDEDEELPHRDDDGLALLGIDPSALPREVAIKILPLMDCRGDGGDTSSITKLDRERMRAKKREASVLKRLHLANVTASSSSHLPPEPTFIIEVVAILEMKTRWPDVQQRFFTIDANAPPSHEDEDATTQGEMTTSSCSSTSTSASSSDEQVAQTANLVEASIDAHVHREGMKEKKGKMKSGSSRPASTAGGSAIAIVMPYYRQSLFDYLETRLQQRRQAEEGVEQGLDLHEALVLLKQMASAIAHCHRHGICHRDVKLENFMWNQAKREVRLIDFGSCGVIRQGKLFSHPCGSPSYIAPEVVQGKGYSENVDIWALGVCFYALLTGRFPFGSGSATSEKHAELFYRIVHQRVFIPQHMPSKIADLLLHMLCRDRKRRFNVENVLTHPALATISTSMGDAEQMERERRRREKGKEKDDIDHYSDDDGDQKIGIMDQDDSARSKKRKQYSGAEEDTPYACC